MLMLNSGGASCRLLSVRPPALQEEPAGTCQGSEAARQRLCADCEERPDHPHQHLFRRRSPEVARQRRCATRDITVADNSMSVLRRIR